MLKCGKEKKKGEPGTRRRILRMRRELRTRALHTAGQVRSNSRALPYPVGHAGVAPAADPSHTLPIQLPQSSHNVQITNFRLSLNPHPMATCHNACHPFPHPNLTCPSPGTPPSIPTKSHSCATQIWFCPKRDKNVCIKPKCTP